jgi:ketopantoate reductase
VGAGAVGALLAAGLHSAGIPTVLIARGDNLVAIQQRGLAIHRPEGTDVLFVPAFAAAPDDVLVVATKTQDVERVVREWAWLPVAGGGVSADLPIVTLQNGLSAEDVACWATLPMRLTSLWVPPTSWRAHES